MYDPKENNLPAGWRKENNLLDNFKGDLIMDIDLVKFQEPTPINVREYIDRRVKEEVTAQITRLHDIVDEELKKLVDGIHSDLISALTKMMVEKLPSAVEQAVSKMVTVTMKRGAN